jgi:fructan beta-fructosidase
MFNCTSKIILITLVTLMATASLRAQQAPLYHEAYRPQFHFSAAKDWINDPNGLLFYQGEYHLFFQRTPGSLVGGGKTWGHAISTDLLHWKQLDDAITPDALGQVWSGSAVVDWNNTSGFQTGTEKVLVAMYTAAGNPFTQCLAYSNDRGRTWTKYAGNPVLAHINGGNRDPRLIWYKPSKEWVMALYLDHNSDYALFTSPDLKKWTRIQTVPIPNAAECPDFFPMNLDGDPSKTMWVMTGANGRYIVGTFDGKAFTNNGQSYAVEHGASCYAVQTFDDIPAADGRRIQIGWMRDGKYPQMPFNQQMSIPCELKLYSTPDGPRLKKYPVREVESLRRKLHDWKESTLQPDTDLLNGLTGDLFDIEAEIEPGASSKTVLNVRGTTVEYDAAAQTLKCGGHAVLPMQANRIKLRVLVDRTSIETFGNGGTATISTCFLPAEEDRAITLKCSGAAVNVVSLKIYEMKSVWEN